MDDLIGVLRMRIGMNILYSTFSDCSPIDLENMGTGSCTQTEGNWGRLI